MGSDRGQTLPLFIWITGAVLFASLAFFAFAQAAVARNGAQSAADAAALAAGQEARDELIDGLLEALESDEPWGGWIDGLQPVGTGARPAAERLAAANDADVEAFGVGETMGLQSFSVRVSTRYTVGESVIPGTEAEHAEAEAVAVVEPRCSVSGEDDVEEVLAFACDGQRYEFPLDEITEDLLPDAAVLYSVHLVD
ncbi:pilus assembly protein TadG-related protein [Streptomyces sp. WAC00276]|uniref:pilus assembly protein TadG-related protein n=1 Tax=Streptomyces sp. WAC00276 TaxID=2933778 RepID=UPI0024954A10|nr:pilus assembly protein TadG-related protein [Streptomyces sp. WAC00276]